LVQRFGRSNARGGRSCLNDANTITAEKYTFSITFSPFIETQLKAQSLLIPIQLATNQQWQIIAGNMSYISITMFAISIKNILVIRIFMQSENQVHKILLARNSEIHYDYRSKI
jgi:hypothetical protein